MVHWEQSDDAVCREHGVLSLKVCLVASQGGQGVTLFVQQNGHRGSLSLLVW